MAKSHDGAVEMIDAKVKVLHGENGPK